MKITKMSTRIDESQEVVETAALDLGTIPVPYSRRGQQWRPEYVSVSWRRDRVNGGDWSTWRLSATVAGPKVKKDGTDSQVRHDVHLYSGWMKSNEIPAELILWIQDSKPDDDLPQPYRRPVEDDVPAPEGRLDLDRV